MKKIMKRMGLFAFVGLLCIQAVIPVRAQPNLSGIDPDARGRITIHRFAGSTSVEPTTGTPLNGIPYTIQLVRLTPGTEQTAANLRNPENFEVITGAGAHSATLSTVNGIANFTDLPQGIYLVTEGAHTITPEADRVAPFIVGIPRRSADGTTWVYDVDVYPKSEADAALSFNKELALGWNATSDSFVATVQFETTVPRLIGNATRFEFVDPLDERLTFIDGSVEGTYLVMEDDDGVLVQAEATLPATAFTATVGTDNALTIALTPSGLTHLATHALMAPEGTLTFTFSATVSTAEVDLGSISNEATLYYNETTGIAATSDMVTQFAIEVESIDVSGNRLNGATFQLFLDAAGTEPAFPNGTGTNRTFTATDGLIFVPALQAGTFYLRETAPPTGFRPVTDVMSVPVGIPQVNPDRNHVVTVQVVNEVEGGFVLPETGGAGTLLFTVIGLGLVGVAISLILVAKRRRDQDD